MSQATSTKPARDASATRTKPGRKLSIEKVAGRIEEVSTLPHVALRVIEIAGDSEAGAGDLTAAVESDPSLAVRVLRCVNSAAYGVRCQITRLQQAVTYLGFNQVRNLAITASVSDVFKTDTAIGPYRRAELWRHLVSAAVCSRLIATRQGLANFEDAFLAGLLHDIGIVLEDQHCHAGFCEMIAALSPDKTLSEIEQEVLGFDHSVLGQRIGRAWKFPPAALAAIRFHHMAENCRGEHATIVQCVEVANLVCTLKDITSVGLKLVRMPRAALDALCLGKEDIKVLATDLDHEISLNRKLFDM